MSGKSIEEEVMIEAQKARHLARYMSSTEDLVERQIQKARERGDFDNLAGAGKPLNLEENPFEPPEMRMALKILKDNDFAPYWVELGKDIDAGFEKLRKETESFKLFTRITLSEKRRSGTLHRYEVRKAAFYSESRERLIEINKKILDYNLHCPTFRAGRANFNVDDEMYKVIRDVEQFIEDLMDSR